MAFVKYVPQTTIQDIVEETIINTRKSIERREIVLRNSLAEIGTDQSNIDKIVQEVLIEDPFLKAQEQLNTEYKRKKVVQSSPNYVHPQEILLNRADVQKGDKKEVYHYVSILESFKVLLQDSSFKQMLAGAKANGEDKIRDVKDGSHYKNNKYFLENEEAFAAILYSDAVEMSNPLGAATGKYKVVFVYYTLCEIEKPQRSKIDRIQLAMAFKEKLLKKYSLKTIMKPLINDLRKLETGIEVQGPTRTVKCGVACFVADNLEASLLGGFSLRDICRMCHIQHNELEDEICDTSGSVHSPWTVEEYNAICDSRFHEEEEFDGDEDQATVVDEENLFTEYDFEESDARPDADEAGEAGEESEEETEDDGNIETKGLNHRCPLNTLMSFHSVNGFPFDIMHDLFEGNFQ